VRWGADQILKITAKSGQQSQSASTPSAATETANVVHFPHERDADLDPIAKWVGLADRVLGNPIKERKKA